MPRPTSGPIALPALLAAAGSLGAQVQWQRIEMPPATSSPVVHDPVRDRYLRLVPPNGVGSPETWEWDRQTGWLRHRPTATPRWHHGHALTHDLQRGVTVLFGSSGTSVFPFRDTWEWDGITWTNRSPALQPGVRTGHAMAYDVGRGRVVLFGGVHTTNSALHYADTWEWDGTAWSQQPGPGPPARERHALAYDGSRGEIVLFGGRAVSGALGDTWAYQGGAWSLRAGSGPPARFAHAMAFDAARSRLVAFGGTSNAGTALDDTWEWDGATWQPLVVAARPQPRAGSGLAPDPVAGGVLLFGGNDATTTFADVWRWDGAAWSRLEDTPRPGPRHSHAMAFDEARGELLVFGGIDNSILGDLWRWNGATWSQSQAAGPSPRTRAVMVHDAARAETVLFGGELPGFTNETWTYDGTTWTRRSAALSPNPRILHAMAFDRQRARVVLFGGMQNVFNNYFLGDTWEWDGSAWSQRSGGGPQPRHGHGLAYDPRRGVTVLYGGLGAGSPFGTVLDDTWEWNGLTWLRRHPPTNPGGRVEFMMAFDAVRDRVVVFGDQTRADTWEFDGNDWAPRTMASGPPARGRGALAFDSWRARIVLFGGQSIGPNHSDLWLYGAVVPAAVLALGTGCPGSSGVPQFALQGLPWLGAQATLVLARGPAAAPAAIWLGQSRSSHAGIALPLALDPLGAAGCTVFASPDVAAFALSSAGGMVVTAITLPDQPALLGAEIHAQGAFADPAANAAGIALSDALTLRVGGR